MAVHSSVVVGHWITSAASKLGFDGIADFTNDEGDGVWSNSEVIGQAWITVTAGQVS